MLRASVRGIYITRQLGSREASDYRKICMLEPRVLKYILGT